MWKKDKTTDDSVKAFMMYAETWAGRLGKNSLADVDVVSF